MANPNIASIGELYGGTLAWQLEPTQIVNANSSNFTITQTSGWADNTNTYTMTNGTYLANNGNNRLLVILGWSGRKWDNNYSARIPHTMSLSTDGAGTVFNGDTWTWDRGGMKMFYWLNPTTGSDQTLTVSATVNSSSSRNMGWTGFTLYNVHQTDPFGLQLTNGQGSGSFASKYVQGSHYYGNTTYTATVTSTPGQASIVLTGAERYNYNTNVSVGSPDTGSDVTNMANGGYEDAYIRTNLVHAPNNANGSYNISVNTSSFGSGTSYDYSTSRIITLRGADAPTLFTVPTGYAVKVNQIYVDADGANLTFSSQVQGLGASGATPNTIHDSAGNDIITAVSNVAVGNLCTGVTITPGQVTKVLTQPIWLTEGNKLAASLGYSEGSMLSVSAMRPTPKATVTVAMDIIKQSA